MRPSMYLFFPIPIYLGPSLFVLLQWSLSYIASCEIASCLKVIFQPVFVLYNLRT